ncbi:membrane-associated protein, putative [Bodo saltans]|uniref:Membrane-associated protein, putative n=1 Tax=Bodo saltans TaxID=75058 RepID=A0A0S4IMZ3_BODSA|nr:membrane-associated protein, putative [Bodo saltans]|eukprot:CUF57284.1 membrane-associated protein, putative [Bodo saltans]
MSKNAPIVNFVLCTCTTAPAAVGMAGNDTLDTPNRVWSGYGFLAQRCKTALCCDEDTQ